MEKHPLSHYMTERLKYRARNVLTLEDRIKVIREYEVNPKYQRLAKCFNCSPKQIKNIIANRAELLRHYKNFQDDTVASEVATRRQQKIDFLGKVVYEFLLRSLCQRQPVGAWAIRQKALEVKEAIAIENFYPNDAWLQDFKTKYNMVDLGNMAAVEMLMQAKNRRRSLKCIDIIEYISRKERDVEERQKRVNGQMCDKNDRRLVLPIQKKTQVKATSAVSVINAAIDDDDDDGDYGDEDDKMICDDDVVTLDSDEGGDDDDDDDNDDDDGLSSSSTEQTTTHTSTTTTADTNNNNSNNSNMQQQRTAASDSLSTTSALTPLPDIHSYNEALRHLKVLEDFAMIEENYRAIGLITQLEQIFKNPPKLKKFNG